MRRAIGWFVVATTFAYLMTLGVDWMLDGYLSSSAALRTAALEPNGRARLRVLGLANVVGAIALVSLRVSHRGGLVNLSAAWSAVFQLLLLWLWVKAYPQFPWFVPLIAAGLLLVVHRAMPALQPREKGIPPWHWPLAVAGLARVFWPA